MPLELKGGEMKPYYNPLKVPWWVPVLIAGIAFVIIFSQGCSYSNLNRKYFKAQKEISELKLDITAYRIALMRELGNLRDYPDGTWEEGDSEPIAHTENLRRGR